MCSNLFFSSFQQNDEHNGGNCDNSEDNKDANDGNNRGNGQNDHNAATAKEMPERGPKRARPYSLRPRKVQRYT